jgi:hypothetical protein
MARTGTQIANLTSAAPRWRPARPVRRRRARTAGAPSDGASAAAPHPAVHGVGHGALVAGRQHPAWGIAAGIGAVTRVHPNPAKCNLSSWAPLERPREGYTRGTERLRFIALIALVGCVVALGVSVSRPPRVLLVGDSITGEYAPSAVGALRHDGYHAIARAYPGVGLLDRMPRVNAPAALRHDLGSVSPSVVVAEFSGNYGIADPPLAGVPLGSEAFFTAWDAEVQTFTREATGNGATVVWLLAPRPVRGDTTVNDRLDALYRDEQQRGAAGVLDPSTAVSLFDRGGNLYAPDGRHLSATGVKLIADLVVHDVERHPAWRLRVGELARSPLAISALAVAIVALAALIALGFKRHPRRERRPLVPATR